MKIFLITIQGITLNYFIDIYKSWNPSNWHDIIKGFNPRVSDDMNSLLIRPVSYKEIKVVIFAINPSKALREDSYINFFFFLKNASILWEL